MIVLVPRCFLSPVIQTQLSSVIADKFLAFDI